MNGKSLVILGICNKWEGLIDGAYLRYKLRGKGLIKEAFDREGAKSSFTVRLALS